LVEHRGDQTPRRELFHVGRDPEELHNLAEAEPKQIKKMVARMDEAAQSDRRR